MERIVNSPVGGDVQGEKSVPQVSGDCEGANELRNKIPCVDLQLESGSA